MENKKIEEMVNQKMNEKKRRMNEVEHWQLEELKKLTDKNLTLELKHNMNARTLGTIITMLGRQLIKTDGYSVVGTVLKRDLRELGRKDASMIRQITGLNEMTEENVKCVINIVAMILGLKLGLVGEKKVGVVDCPFYSTVKEFDEPFMCNACIEYNRGLVEELIGNNFDVKRVKWFFDGDDCCIFDVKKV